LSSYFCSYFCYILIIILWQIIAIYQNTFYIWLFLFSHSCNHIKFYFRFVTKSFVPITTKSFVPIKTKIFVPATTKSSTDLYIAIKSGLNVWCVARASYIENYFVLIFVSNIRWFTRKHLIDLSKFSFVFLFLLYTYNYIMVDNCNISKHILYVKNYLFLGLHKWHLYDKWRTNCNWQKSRCRVSDTCACNSKKLMTK